MAKYKDKWKTTFPTSIGNQTRPEDGVDNTQEYNTDGLPQYMANDPVRYDLQNAVNSQLVSNDERLNEKIKRTSDDLAAHNKDPKAHATGIAGNAATATKLQTPRTLSLTGKAAGSATFDGSSNAAINVTSVNADTASKLSTARKINITGNASGSASFDGTSDVSINVSVSQAAHAAAADTATKVNATVPPDKVGELVKAKMGDNDAFRIAVGGSANNGWVELATADDGTESIYVRQYADAKIDGFVTPTRTATLLDGSGNTSFPGKVTAPNFIGSLNGNAATATKLQTPRTLALTGKASGSTTFDGSANASINVTSVNADTASKLSTARKINITGNASGSASFDGSGDVSISTTVNESKHAVNADVAKTLETTDVNGVKNNATLYWVGKDGQPLWLWGSNTKPSEIYVYNPYNFHVAKADTATTANGSNGTFIVNPGNVTNYNEGIRVAEAKDEWSLIMLGCQAGSTEGTTSGSWLVGVNPDDNFLLCPNASEEDIGLCLQKNSDTVRWNNKIMLTEGNYNNYAPTKTGGGASGTWGISISGNAASATNADKLDGYHASDIISKIQDITPKTAAAIGQFRELVVNDSHQVKLPGGGTWAYFVYTYNSWSGDNSNSEHRTRTGAGIAAGGTVLHTDGNITSNTINAFKLSGTTGAGGADDNNIIVGGFCWRIA